VLSTEGYSHPEKYECITLAITYCMPTQQINSGDTLLRVPFELCMSLDAARRSPLTELLDAHPRLMEEQDEVLCLCLMYTRSVGTESPWYAHVACMPERVSVAFQWNEEERCALAGTSCGALAPLLERQMLNV
jgi:hypothetical protein